MPYYRRACRGHYVLASVRLLVFLVKSQICIPLCSLPSEILTLKSSNLISDLCPLKSCMSHVTMIGVLSAVGREGATEIVHSWG